MGKLPIPADPADFHSPWQSSGTF